jgi:hypothetical protein
MFLSMNLEISKPYVQESMQEQESMQQEGKIKGQGKKESCEIHF